MVKPRTGSVYFNARRNRWMGAISVGGGKRRAITALTEADARAKLALLDPTTATAPRGAHPALYRTQKANAAGSVLARAEELGWDRSMTARVLAASLTKSRIKAGVSGPCVYCGDELADTVDHVVPFARGGLDEPSNVVSACVPCNARKGRN